MAALVSAWTLLKNRGQELDLPPPVETNKDRFTVGLSPQDITDRRVDESQSDSHDDGGFMQRRLALAQRYLDQQTMTREGQQGEADEMDAMGVPDMGRSVGGRAPPNVGRAGSSDTDEEDMASLSPEEITRFQDYNVNQRPNPFPQRTMKSFDAAWKLLKGDYDQDMQQLQMLDGQQTAQAVAQNPPPAAYGNNPEGWAEDYMSQMADYQGALSANVGDPNFPLSQLAGMKTQAGEKMDATMEEHSQREKRLAELKAMGEQMRFEESNPYHRRFEGRPPL
jgi:hypothetical protein